MSNFLRNLSSSKSSSKELSQKQRNEQHNASSSSNDITNEFDALEKIENDFLNWRILKLASITIYFQNTLTSKKIFVSKLLKQKSRSMKKLILYNYFQEII